MFNPKFKGPDEIFLIKEDEDCIVWCDVADPHEEHDPVDAVKYIRADLVGKK